MMWYYDNNNHWGWGGWLMIISMVLFWSVIIAAARYFAGPRRTDTTVGTHDSRPEDTLAQRFARGEIDEDEYHRRLTILREHHTSPPGH